MFATVSHNVTIASLLPLAASMGCRITSKPFRKGNRPAISLTRSNPVRDKRESALSQTTDAG